MVSKNSSSLMVMFMWVAGFGALLFSGCASSGANKYADVSGDEVETIMGGKAIIYTVPSAGGINDAMVSLLNATAGPSRMVRQLAEVMAKGEEEPVRLAVEGYAIDKTADTIEAALKLNQDKKLEKLKLLYIGSEARKDGVKKATEGVGAEFLFKSIFAEGTEEIAAS